MVAKLANEANNATYTGTYILNRFCFTHKQIKICFKISHFIHFLAFFCFSMH